MSTVIERSWEVVRKTKIQDLSKKLKERREGGSLEMGSRLAKKAQLPQDFRNAHEWNPVKKLYR